METIGLFCGVPARRIGHCGGRRREPGNGAGVPEGDPHVPVLRSQSDSSARAHLPVLPLRRLHRSARRSGMDGHRTRERLPARDDPARDRRKDLVGGREVHWPVVHLRQPRGEVPRHRAARTVDERWHRAELRHHRPHAQLCDAGRLHDGDDAGGRHGGHRRVRPADAHALAACHHAAARQGVFHDALDLVQRLGHRAALLLLDEHRHQGRRQPRTRLPGHELHRARRGSVSVADRPGERKEPGVLRTERLRFLQVIPRPRPRVRLLRRLLARRRLRDGALRATRR